MSILSDAEMSLIVFIFRLSFQTQFFCEGPFMKQSLTFLNDNLFFGNAHYLGNPIPYTGALRGLGFRCGKGLSDGDGLDWEYLPFFRSEGNVDQRYLRLVC